MTAGEFQQQLAEAECLQTAEQVASAVAAVARAVSDDMATQNPLLLSVMTGGLPFTAALMAHLSFPLHVDYLHATRYGNGVVGAGVRWLAKPQLSLRDRHVLIVDDIFDEGLTLMEIVNHCRQQGAASVASAVLVAKPSSKSRVSLQPDYIGLHVPDRFVFGCGMDYQGYGRNLPAIYALAIE